MKIKITAYEHEPNRCKYVDINSGLTGTIDPFVGCAIAQTMGEYASREGEKLVGNRYAVPEDAIVDSSGTIIPRENEFVLIEPEELGISSPASIEVKDGTIVIKDGGYTGHSVYNHVEFPVESAKSLVRSILRAVEEAEDGS